MQRALMAAMALPGLWISSIAPAQAGLLDIFRRKEPEPEGMMLFGLPISEVAITALIVVFVLGVLIYRPRTIVEMLSEAVGQALAWVAIVVVMIAVLAIFIYFSEGLPILAALIGAVIVVGIVVIGNLWD
ncbi:MAG: hypothetical protein AAGB15_12475 [Pseudomonadota bacterium]